jgi:arylamine N-acetyltransferase
MKEFEVTKQQADQFLSAIQISEIENSPSGLELLINTTLGRVPFTNIMMLVRPRRSPTHQEIIEDMLSLRGGPCGHFNPFMNELLRHLGFDSSLVPGWMEGKLSHMAIIVKINANEWWLDFGNGHPYLSPININSNDVKCHAGLSYRVIVNSDSSYSLEHRLPHEDSFSQNYRFTTERVPFSFFDEMVESHYTTPGFGPFLSGVRFIRYPLGEMLAIRDNQLLKTTDGKISKEKIKSLDEMERLITTGFEQATYPLARGMEVLGWS